MITFELFVNFNGNCRSAVEFYSKVFKTEVKNLMTYGETTTDEKNPLDDADKDRIMYAEMLIGDKNVMFMDMPSAEKCVVGSNIMPTINTSDKFEITRLYDALKDGGVEIMPPQKTFFSELYAMVTDKFGITWHILAA